MASLSTEELGDIPDFMTDPDAVLHDSEAEWRYSRPPDYTRTRKYFAETRRYNHKAGSLEALIENLVKNWEIEASFKTRLADWRTVDVSQYTFAINGLDPCSAEYMLRVGTYNAIITPCEYYDPTHSDFASSHKTFKRMMPTFAWEVVEVYSGPPVVSFKWRHWGEMKNDYVGWNVAGEKVTVKPSDRPIDIEGVTVVHLNDKSQIIKLKTWFDSNEIFKQMDPERRALREPAVREGQVYDYSAASGPAAINGGIIDAGLPQAAGCPMMTTSGRRAPGGDDNDDKGIPELNAE
ncbi:hypothetical protein F5X99DRAFT_331372 [Biscogniauxia marginata]|nr:hypothetical protein F5X99DRAFT_331372 [Biscogniauxia marginata]